MKIEQRRRLTDLYVVGEEVKIAWDPEPENPEAPIWTDVVWVRKMTPTENETAYAKASAVRASVLALKNEDPSSDQFVTLQQDVRDMDPAILKLWAVSTEMARRRQLIESRVAFEKEWTKEGYLAGLLELAGDPDFQAKAEEKPDDSEVLRVQSELARFEKDVEEAVASEQRKLETEYGSISLSELQEHVLDEVIKMQADAAWLIEFRKCQVWLSTMQADKHGEKYFVNRKEVDALQEEVLEQLQTVCEKLNVPVSEGKELPPKPSS